MAFRLAPSDYEMLQIIAEYRIMTSPQLAALLSRSKKGVRDRISKLIVESLLEEVPRGRGQHRGRPERIVFLNKPGVTLLKEQGLIESQVPTGHLVGDKTRCQNHQLLLNWVRIHLNRIETVAPGLKVRCLAHNSPFLPKEFSSVSVCSKTGELLRFEPDATFSIYDSNKDKTLLFFLEVDLSTETLASPRRILTDIRQKILNYGICFDMQVYRRYERLWNCQLNGFRLLFLTDTSLQMSKICSLAREMQPSDFIWVTQKDRMFEDGISADIWARGGRLDVSPQSILGRLSCRAPLS
ncbi:MAG: replication-relaxation family protein [Deltaproteobacteria bacterium]|nr:replication-relaxation family protein [Deltaproteobacteria bacterium]